MNPCCAPDGSRPTNGWSSGRWTQQRGPNRRTRASQSDRSHLDLCRADGSHRAGWQWPPQSAGRSDRGYPTEWWACAPAGGVWRTTQDGKATWTAMGNGQLESIGVTDIAFHPTDPNRLWIATGDGDFGDTRSIGIWTSADGGTIGKPQDWTGHHSWAEPCPESWSTLSNPDTLWAASSLGIYRSVDGGDQWSRPLTGNMASPGTGPQRSFPPLGGGIRQHHCREPRCWRNLGDIVCRWPKLRTECRIALAFSPSQPNIVYALGGKISTKALPESGAVKMGGIMVSPHDRGRRAQPARLDRARV